MIFHGIDYLGRGLGKPGIDFVIFRWESGLHLIKNEHRGRRSQVI